MQRKGILQFMKNCIDDSEYNKNITDNLCIVELIRTLFSYFYMHYGLRDIEERGKCKHQLRFSLLYMEKNRLSFDEIADETLLNIGNDTFKYHIRNYNNTVLNYIKEESNIDSDHAFLLEEYLKSGL